MANRNYMYLNPTQRDGEYVELYRTYGSTIKAAEHCDVSRETIARAVRRSGIKLDGRKQNHVAGGTPMKATNDPLIILFHCQKAEITHGIMFN